MKDLSTKSFETGFNIELYQDYMIQKNIDQFTSEIINNEIHSITDQVVTYINLPNIGSHLVTKRVGYTHHGIYIGDKKVIQYSGFSGKGFNTNDVIPIDSYNRSSIEIVSLENFTRGNKYWIDEHTDATYSPDEIVKRAYKKLAETKYNVVFNNCEHFVNYCVYGIKYSKQTNMILKPLTRGVSEVYHVGKMTLAYINGDIKWEKFLDEISYAATVGVSSFLYTGLGQVIIPIPFVGALVGSIVGYILGGLLYSSGMFSITGDSKIVKQAKQRRAKIEHITNIMLPIMKKSRLELEQYMEKYFADRKNILDESFGALEIALKENKFDVAVENLSKINQLYDKELTYKSFDEFDEFMKN